MRHRDALTAVALVLALSSCSAPSTPARAPTNTAAETTPSEPAATHTSATQIGGAQAMPAGQKEPGTIPVHLHWTTGPPMPVGLSEVAVAAVGTKIHVLGGYVAGVPHSRTHLVYDTVAKRWSLGAQLPARLDHIGAAVAGGHLYAFGGYGADGTPTTGVYELVGDNWLSRKPLRVARAAALVVTVGDKIHVIAGRTVTGDTDRHDVYDPATDSWSADAPVPQARDHAAAAVVDGRVIVAGGRPGSLASAVSYDPATDRWTTLPRLPVPRNSIAGAAFDGSFLVIGGETAAEQAVFTTVSAYDPATNRWRALPSLPHGLQGIGAAVVGSVLYVPGGGPSGGGSEQSDVLMELTP